MLKRRYVTGAVSGLALLGGVWTGSLLAANESPPTPPVNLGAPSDGSITAVPSDGVAFDTSTAEVVGNDEYGSTLHDASGVFRTDVSVVPVQVERDGAWIPASNAVTQGDGEVVAEDHPLTPSFPAVLGDEPILNVDAAGHAVTFTLEGQRDGGAAKVDSAADSQGDSKVTYPDAVAGADAVYDVVAGAVKENFHVHVKPSEKLQFSWVIDAPGLTLVRNEFGGVNMVTVFTVKQDGIVIMDSVAGSKANLSAGGTGVSSVTLPYALTAGAHYTVEVKAFDGHLASGVATSGPHWFTGPPRSIREISGNNDGDTGATS